MRLCLAWLFLLICTHFFFFFFNPMIQSQSWLSYKMNQQKVYMRQLSPRIIRTNNEHHCWFEELNVLRRDVLLRWGQMKRLSCSGSFYNTAFSVIYCKLDFFLCVVVKLQFTTWPDLKMKRVDVGEGWRWREERERENGRGGGKRDGRDKGEQNKLKMFMRDCC